MLTLIRCDDRLIHGQCMTVITKEYDIARIIVVDDTTANNPILKTVFTTAVPPSMSAKVYTVDEAVPEITAAREDNVKTLVLMKDPTVYNQLLEKMPDLPKTLNVGPMSSRKDTISVTKTIHLLPKEAEAVKELAAKGVDVYFQQVPAEHKVTWAEVADRF